MRSSIDVSFCLGCTSQVASATPCMAVPLEPSPSSSPLDTPYLYCSYNLMPKTLHRIQSEAAPVQSRGGQSPPSMAANAVPDVLQDTVSSFGFQGTADSY